MRRLAPRPAALLAVISASVSAVLVKLSQASPVTATFFRVAYALPLLAVVAVVSRRVRRSPRDRLLALASGVLLTVDLVMFHASISDIGAGLASVMVQTQVVFVTVLSWVFDGDRPQPLTWLGLAAAASGAVLVSGLGAAPQGNAVRGVVLGVGAGLAFAIFLYMFRSSNSALSPPATPLLDASVGTAASAFIASQWLGGIDFAMTAVQHAWLITLAVVVQVVAWLLFTHALPRLRAVETSSVILLQPVLAVAWAQIVFGEPIGGAQVVGAILIVGSVWLLVRSQSRAGHAGDRRPARFGARTW